MNIENARQSHRHGEAWEQVQEPKLKDVNWWIVGSLLALAGFWCWVGYNVAQWLP